MIAEGGRQGLAGDAVAVLDSRWVRSQAGRVDRLFDRGCLKGALIDGLGLKPRKAFGPIRVAITGATVSPPLFESLELLGRERSLRAGCARPATESAGNLW